MTRKLPTGEENTVHGDSGYLGAEKREDALLRNIGKWNIKYRINERPSSLRKKAGGEAEANTKNLERRKSSVRARSEHKSGIVKGTFKYQKTRYKGLANQKAKLHMLFALANLVLHERRVSTA